jgi:mono/diheme cytochrome c family protein
MTLRVYWISLTLLVLGISSSHAQNLPDDAGETVEGYRKILNQYCVTCHNETLKTANLLLDKVDLLNLTENPRIWERVITKLSLRQMPPVGMPRPEESFYESFPAYLATALDKFAKANPDPGKMVYAHRLNRTEYTNAVRDLLGVEIDGPSLLPPDNSGGFDNLGDLLSVSEVLMESYMSAARKISRMAVGDPTIQADTLEYNIDPKLLQNDRMDEDLPFGTRGGLAVRHNFPVDGEYEMNIRLMKTSNSALIIGINEPHRMDVRIDGKRVKLLTIGGENVGLGLANGGADKVPPDFAQAQYERTADSKLTLRFPMKAGTRLVQIAFLDETFAWEGHIPPQTFENWTKARIESDYERAWRDPWVSSVLITGPLDVKGPGNSVSRDTIFICSPRKEVEEEACARRILSNLVRLAHRQPPGERAVNSLLSLYQKGRSESGTFDGGIQMALEGLLVSTEFLFRIERDPSDLAENSIYPISDLDLASRLSFFLWSSIPDNELLSVAEQGRLREPAVLTQQVKRMLKDGRSRNLVSDFADQWLLLRNLPQLDKNQDIFPDFDETLRQNLYTEIQLFIGSIFREDRSILDLFRADYTYLNERLARHYGVKNVYGNRFRKVTLDDVNKRGLLARASIMAITTYPNRNSTVLRGKWVLDNILASPPPPPPPNVPPLEATKAEAGQSVLTLRERMEIHPANPVCAVCHNQMDPIGFGLENYDAIGRWRTEDEGKPINAAGKLPSGIGFEGPAELQRALLSNPEVVVNAFTQKLLTYALGRPVEYFDMPTVRGIVAEAADNDYRFSSIVFGIINSTPFNMRRAGS